MIIHSSKKSILVIQSITTLKSILGSNEKLQRKNSLKMRAITALPIMRMTYMKYLFINLIY